jgi:hypothetical protein
MIFSYSAAPSSVSSSLSSVTLIFSIQPAPYGSLLTWPGSSESDVVDLHDFARHRAVQVAHRLHRLDRAEHVHPREGLAPAGSST